MFGFKPRTSVDICAAWVKNGFLKVVDPSNEGRKHAISDNYRELIIKN